jgi:hypothetical protein
MEVAAIAQMEREILPNCLPDEIDYSSGMKIKPFRWPLLLLTLNTAVLIAVAGCATHEERSFNQDYNQGLSTAPKYYIENVDADHFKVIVHQGAPTTEAQSTLDLKKVASIVAATEARRQGWPNWELNYIQQGHKGWMHEVTAIVARKNAVERMPDSNGRPS